ncbi:MAG: DUF1211 domain-containing protein [Solirubrobacterales bacterium]|nr:DUF1211 domain-containing protein [Solirubrobacterales bacterium]
MSSRLTAGFPSAPDWTPGAGRTSSAAPELYGAIGREPGIGTIDSWHALGHELPVLLAYVLSFVYLGIYWNNHHHMLAAVSGVSGASLWANLHLLFWLSLIPFSTAWMSEHRFPPSPRLYVAVALIWLLPDRRVERHLTALRTEATE